MEINWRAPVVHTRYIVIVVKITTFTIAIIDIIIIGGIFDFNKITISIYYVLNTNVQKKEKMNLKLYKNRFAIVGNSTATIRIIPHGTFLL